MIPDALKSVVLSVGQPCGIPVGSAVYPGIISKMSKSHHYVKCQNSVSDVLFVAET